MVLTVLQIAWGQTTPSAESVPPGPEAGSVRDALLQSDVVAVVRQRGWDEVPYTAEGVTHPDITVKVTRLEVTHALKGGVGLVHCNCLKVPYAGDALVFLRVVDGVHRPLDVPFAILVSDANGRVGRLDPSTLAMTHVNVLARGGVVMLANTTVPEAGAATADGGPSSFPAPQAFADAVARVEAIARESSAP